MQTPELVSKITQRQKEYAFSPSEDCISCLTETCPNTMSNEYTHERKLKTFTSLLLAPVPLVVAAAGPGLSANILSTSEPGSPEFCNWASSARRAGCCTPPRALGREGAGVVAGGVDISNRSASSCSAIDSTCGARTPPGREGGAPPLLANAAMTCNTIFRTYDVLQGTWKDTKIN